MQRRIVAGASKARCEGVSPRAQRRRLRLVSRRLNRSEIQVEGGFSGRGKEERLRRMSGRLTRSAVWRRGWDLNPRSSYPDTGFRDRHVRPLRHLSTAGHEKVKLTVSAGDFQRKL